MSAMKRLIGGCVFVSSLLTTTALAQEVRAPLGPEREPVAAVAPLVTATATATRVRFVAPGTVTQLRLEVYNESGQKVFDTELHGGNVLDWHLQDGAGERLLAGSYASVLTIKSLSGRLSQRLGVVTVNDKKATLEPGEAVQLSVAQQSAIGAVEGNAAFTVLRQNEAEAITTVTHDGTDGQVTRTRGALSFRLGDFFSGEDKEQMLLTEEGNLGLGTSKPQAKLDVTGDIRATGTVQASKGISFADGTVQNTGTSGRLDASGNLVPNATGTGTQNQLSKWTDSSGTLGNSIITESPSGFIGISNTNPTAKLSVSASSGAELRFDQGASGITPVLSVISQPGSTTSGAASILGAGTGGSSFVFSDNLPFFLVRDTKAHVVNNQLGNGTVLFTILPAGNVGMGTTAPGAKLDVAGDVNTSTQYNIGGSRVLSVAGQDNLFVGVGAGSANTGEANSFFGKTAGQANTSGSGNSFFGSKAGLTNTEGGGNTFFGNEAGQSNSLGNSNSYFGNAAGWLNQTGGRNVFIGMGAGFNNNSGNDNAFIGNSAGKSNTYEHDNTFIGSLSNGVAGIINAGAIGYRAMVTQSNSLVLGSINGTNGAVADTRVGIGITAPSFKLHILDPASSGLRVETSLAGGRVASFASNGDFQIDAPFIPGGRFAVMEGGNVGINTATPGAKLQVVGGDVAISTQSKGLILKAIDGPNCVRLTVNNAGQLGTTFVPCP
jgi:hypothetical protein